MKKYKAILMDFDQTIGDNADLIVECLYKNATRFGHTPDLEVIKKGVGRKASDIYRDAGIKDEAEIERLTKVYFDFSNEVMNDSGFFPFVPESLNALHDRGLLLGILSLKVSSQIWEPLKRHGLDHCIHTVLGLYDITNGKPDPEGIFKLAKIMNLSLEDILYVGDSFTDRETAINAGVDFAAVCTGVFTKEDFEAEPYGEIYADFGEMAKALCLVLDK